MNDWRLNWMMPAEPLGPAIKAKEPEPPKPAEPAHDWSCAQESDRPPVASMTRLLLDSGLLEALNAATRCLKERREAELAAAAKRVDEILDDDTAVAQSKGVPAHVWHVMTNEGRAALRKQWWSEVAAVMMHIDRGAPHGDKTAWINVGGEDRQVIVESFGVVGEP